MRFYTRALLLALLVAAPLIAVHSYEALSLQSRQEVETREAALSHARSVASELDLVFRGLRQFLVAASLSVPASGAACQPYLEELTRRLAADFRLAVIAPDGEMVCRTGPDFGFSDGDKAYLTQALRTRDFAMASSLYGISPSASVLQFAYPIVPNSGEPTGVLMLSVNAAWIADQLAKHPLPAGASVTVADRNARIVVRLPERNRIGESLPGAWSHLLTGARAGDDEPVSPEPGRVVASVPLHESAPGFMAAVGLQRHAALRGAASWRWPLLIVLATVVGFATAVLALRRRLKRQADSLQSSAQRWAAGDYQARSDLPPQAELDRLAATLESMAVTLQQREAERLRADEDVRRSRDDALQASLAKSRFLAAASHDLRQPLQSMSMTVALLGMRHKADADTPVIARLNRAVSNLADLLNTLLDISQLEAGVVKPSLKSVSVGGLLCEISEEYGAVAESKGLTFNVERCDFSIRSDPGMLLRMMRNLVENAIRFTPSGGMIHIFCRDEGATLLLIVKDTGIGIPHDKREEIFRAFQQLNNPERDRSKGLGLGLAIVDRMSRLLGHRVHLESVPSEGSSFAIELPKASPSGVDAAPDAGGGAVHGRVLLVEDDQLVLETTAQLLEALGATVSKAHSAEDALKRLEKSAYDLVIADYRLPGSSGIELVRRARERQHGIAAAIITGDPSIEELKRLVDLDTEVIQKPVRADRLARLFSKATHA